MVGDAGVGGVGLQSRTGGWRDHTPHHASAERAKWKRGGGNEKENETTGWWGGVRRGPLRLPTSTFVRPADVPEKNRGRGLHTAAPDHPQQAGNLKFELFVF